MKYSFRLPVFIALRPARMSSSRNTFSLLLAERSNALTAPKSNHIVTMLPSFKVVMWELRSFFPVGNTGGQNAKKNLSSSNGRLRAPAAGRVHDSVRNGTAKQQQQ